MKKEEYYIDKITKEEALFICKELKIKNEDAWIKYTSKAYSFVYFDDDNRMFGTLSINGELQHLKQLTFEEFKYHFLNTTEKKLDVLIDKLNNL